MTKGLYMHYFSLIEENKGYYISPKGRFYSYDLTTTKCVRISQSDYENYLSIYHEG